MELRFRLALVTGAGAGLGRVLALALGRAGASVLVVDRDRDAAAETAELVRAARVQTWSLQADVCEESDLRMLAGRARDLGGVDLLVNNAGGWTPDAQFPDAPLEEWSRTLDLNLRAPMALTQAFLAGLDERRGRTDGTPAAVNIASSAGLGHDGYGSPEYAAAKAGLIRFTTALGDPATAARARVMALVPGWIGLERAERQWAGLTEHERTGLAPLIPPAEVARAVLGLLAHGSAGSVLELVGGREPRELG